MYYITLQPCRLIYNALLKGNSTLKKMLA